MTRRSAGRCAPGRCRAVRSGPARARGWRTAAWRRRSAPPRCRRAGSGGCSWSATKIRPAHAAGAPCWPSGRIVTSRLPLRPVDKGGRPWSYAPPAPDLEKPMKILLINANTTPAVTERIAAEARRVATPGTEVLPVTGTFGAPIIGTRAEMAVAEHSALDLFARHGAGVDAVVIGVSFDVGLRALRELAPVPVVGMTEAACLMACTLGGPFGIVTYGARSAAILREIVAGYGLAGRVAGGDRLHARP